MRNLAVLSVVVLVAGCSRAPIVLHYPDERLVFPKLGDEPPTLFVEFVNDMRPDTDRLGPGSFATVHFPADDEWDRPVSQIYYEALVKDLGQTQLVEIVPLRSQADYVLEVDLLRLGAKVSRGGGSYTLAAAAGAGLGYIVAQGVGGAIVGALIGVGAMPAPARVEAVTEVRLKLHDNAAAPVWEQACRGEMTKSMWAGVTSRSDQAWVDKYLTVAIKRCNACLLGQLRQALQ